VRLGTQKSRLGSPLPDDFSAGMNTVDVTMMERLTAKLLHMVIDTCTRTRDEVAI